MNKAVLFLTYRRFETTERVFSAIRDAKPPRLYFASNAPDPTRASDVAAVEAVRSLVKRIDWPCETHRLFRTTHLPVRLSIPSSVDWFFEHEEQGIVLEDDCVPGRDFFRFCDELLDRYKNHAEVWTVTGDNFQEGNVRGHASYYFSRYNHVWGWASWRRAWQQYDVNMSFWPEWRKTREWKRLFDDRVEWKYWTNIFDQVFRGDINTWDYQWLACMWYKGGVTVTPNVNLVSNIGFGPDAANTKSATVLDGIPVSPLGRVTHPSEVTRHIDADRFVFDQHFGGQNLRWPRWGAKKIKGLLQRIRRTVASSLPVEGGRGR